MPDPQVVADRFEIVSMAGSGAMGTVYSARDRHTGGRVALKVLHTASADGAPRFLREAELLAGLRHPGIVRHIAHGQVDGAMFLAMEWLEGESLAERLARSLLGVTETLTLVSRVAEVLAAVHVCGVVHRDIKPGNLFLVGGDVRRIKIIDFGIAHLVDPVHIRTRTGMLLGTPGYVSPEQARATRKIDGKADVFSLACVLYKCLTGQHAFPGKTLPEVLTRVQVAEAPRASAARSDVPPEVDALLGEMLRKDPATRPDGAAIVAAISAMRLGPLEPIERVGKAAHAPTLGSDELRLVSVVVVAPEEDEGCDATVGDDPRELGETKLLRRALAVYGARVEPLADGTLIATLTGRRVATDQALHAARCAKTLEAMLPGRAVFVATGRGLLRGTLPHGDVLDHAVHMLRGHTALGGGSLPPIHIDELTAGLLGARFAIGRDEGGLTLLEEHPPLGSVRHIFGSPVPFVGRFPELSRMLEAVDASVSERGGRGVVLLGQAGIGKSRLLLALVEAVLQRAPLARVWVVRGDAVGPVDDGSVFASVVRRAAGIHFGEPVEVGAQKLVRAASALPPDVAAWAAQVLVDFEATQAFSDETGERRAVIDAPAIFDRLSDVLLALIAGDPSRPAVIVVDDLHVADAPSVERLYALVDRASPASLTVIGAGRPEVAASLPSAAKGPRVTSIELGELSRRACENVVRDVLGEAIDEGAIRALVDHAAGHPLSLEELICAAAEGQREGFPETLLAMVQTQLEALGGDARRVLRAASLFGETFPRRGVLALLGGERQAARLDKWLQKLSERGLLVTVRDDDATTFAFASPLLRAATRATVTESDRAQTEAFVAAASRREAPRVSVAPPAASAAISVDACIAAAEKALLDGSATGAIARAEQGVLGGARGERLATLHAIQAAAYGFRGEHGEAMRYGVEAARIAEPGGAGYLTASAVTAVASAWLGNVARLVAIGEELWASRTMERASPLLCGAVARLAIALRRVGRADLAWPLLDRIEPPKPAGPSVLFGWLHLARALQLSTEGAKPSALIEAERQADAAAKSAESEPLLRAQAFAAQSEIRATIGKTNDALTSAKAAMAALDELEGIREGEAMVRLVHAQALYAAGHRDEATSAMGKARERLLVAAQAITDTEWREGFLMNIQENAQTLALAKAWIDFAPRAAR